jgi:hypothetical protein
MTQKEYMAQRQVMLDELEAAKAKINERYNVLAGEYIAEHSPMERLRVYERVEATKHKYKRFVPYQLDVFHMSQVASIRAGGWWLDVDGKPVRWDTLLLTSATPKREYKLSDNQHHIPYEDLKK